MHQSSVWTETASLRSYHVENIFITVEYVSAELPVNFLFLSEIYQHSAWLLTCPLLYKPTNIITPHTALLRQDETVSAHTLNNRTTAEAEDHLLISSSSDYKHFDVWLWIWLPFQAQTCLSFLSTKWFVFQPVESQTACSHGWSLFPACCLATVWLKEGNWLLFASSLRL